MISPRRKSATSQSIEVFIRDSSQTDGRGLTGLAYNSSGLSAYYYHPGGIPTQITLATLANAQASYSSGGFVEVDATNLPGLYRLDLPDAVFETGDRAIVMLKGATNMEPTPVEIPLWSINVNDAVRGGMSALPNAAAEAAGGLFTRGTGAGQIAQSSNGSIDVNAVAISGDSTAADNAEAFFDGTGYNANASRIGTAGEVEVVGEGAIETTAFAEGAVNAAALSTDAVGKITAAIAALVCETNGSYTLQQILSILLAFAAGETENGGATFLDPTGTDDRIIGTVNGSNERTAIILNPSA